MQCSVIEKSDNLLYWTPSTLSMYVSRCDRQHKFTFHALFVHGSPPSNPSTGSWRIRTVDNVVWDTGCRSRSSNIYSLLWCVHLVRLVCVSNCRNKGRISRNLPPSDVLRLRLRGTSAVICLGSSSGGNTQRQQHLQSFLGDAFAPTEVNAKFPVLQHMGKAGEECDKTWRMPWRTY